mmetsp:Transcript_55334/g.160617  ORF Transcript_55334/g.160617 Transcript_55334/m.160617 type:complete len:220 (+) Transcript_55334:486-1145(+)
MAGGGVARRRCGRSARAILEGVPAPWHQRCVPGPVPPQKRHRDGACVLGKLRLRRWRFLGCALRLRGAENPSQHPIGRFPNRKCGCRHLDEQRGHTRRRGPLGQQLGEVDLSFPRSSSGRCAIMRSGHLFAHRREARRLRASLQVRWRGLVECYNAVDVGGLEQPLWRASVCCRCAAHGGTARLLVLPGLRIRWGLRRRLPWLFGVFFILYHAPIERRL